MIPMARSAAAALVTSTLLLAGCATVTRGSHETFGITSKPAGAQAYLSTGDSCVTPCELRMRRADPFQVRIAKPGYVTQTVAVQSKLGGMGGVGLLGNAIIGGLAGASVDGSSGAMHNLTPNPVSVVLWPVPASAKAEPIIAVVPDPSLAGAIHASSAAAPGQIVAKR